MLIDKRHLDGTASEHNLREMNAHTDPLTQTGHRARDLLTSAHEDRWNRSGFYGPALWPLTSDCEATAGTTKRSEWRTTGLLTRRGQRCPLVLAVSVKHTDSRGHQGKGGTHSCVKACTVWENIWCPGRILYIIILPVYVLFRL